MSGLSSNSGDIYTAASPGLTIGSKINISQALMPQKISAVTPLNYAILFDDVIPSAASTTYSAIGVDSVGGIVLKSKLGSVTIGETATAAITMPDTIRLTAGTHTYDFIGSVTSPSIPKLIVNSNPWLGGGAIGLAGVISGIGSGATLSNLVNVVGPVIASIFWTRVGSIVSVTVTGTCSIPAAAVSTMDFTFAQQVQQLNPNFTVSVGCGGGGSTSIAGGANWIVDTVIGTNTVSFNSTGGVVPLDAATTFSFSYC